MADLEELQQSGKHDEENENFKKGGSWTNNEKLRQQNQREIENNEQYEKFKERDKLFNDEEMLNFKESKQKME